LIHATLLGRPRIPGPADLHDVRASLPRQLQPILEQLLSGVTDATASRRLSMSPRTYSRRVAELLEYLGVATRFQGGAEITLRWWLPDHTSARLSAPEHRRKML
jgi:DNA-binding NarL/FixJ family response regulator